jgi:hypothetical protein
MILTFSANGQLSLKNPSICHDKEGYLRVYNDGTYILNFEKGNFKEFTTTDSTVRYSNVEKTTTIYKKPSGNNAEIDSLQIKLLPQSILLKKGNVETEIKNFKEEVNPVIKEFFYRFWRYDKWIYGFSMNYDYPRGLSFYFNGKSLDIQVDIFEKKWSWDIFIDKQSENLSIRYNGYFKNRLESIDLLDTCLQYGMWAFMNSKLNNKIKSLGSFYVDSLQNYHYVAYDNCIKARIPEILLSKMYSYKYYKNGKLNRKRSICELKLCD